MKLLLLSFTALLMVSCASIMPGNDPVLVNAERTTSLAYTTFDSFLSLERQQEVYVKSAAPEVHRFANNLRVNASKWLGTARATTEAYRLNRDAGNKINLTTAVAILQTAISQVTVYTAQISSKTP